ncbi:branched-chain amino acid ABC transporter permease [Silicimonas algicola]|uniref:Amino acid/amide ABC transporter membrane protein 2 (HAAT family) n=1 Tax=Silicimonas algicola TaxID=1826607 RepID=A0A316G3N3_9RHOB|nr:branched-chain amino acid ABC transporter permease [Silicimonas algicola]AZQ66996.1 branched-chain amino acid ABC transporter permease [Silicimonas algicola]PWK55489.1 amino acid/amide ABC transporter membrane protein 2 (HAAT family) [Silicimonas algicola]
MIPERFLNALLLGGLLGVALLADWRDEPFTITLATRATILAIAATGLNLALGLGGLVSLGHAVFFGLGGYAMGILAFHAQTYAPVELGPLAIEGTTSMPLIWVTAIAVSSLAALVIGLLSLRTSGVYFIMITLAFGQMFFYFAVSWSAYGGEDGLSIYVRNGFPGLNTLDPIQFFSLCFVLLCLVLVLWSRLARSPFGLALNAARQVPARVETVGLDPKRLKLAAFVLSGAITGLAGALFADLNRFVSPSMFSWQLSGELIVLVILGGVARLCGPVAGAMLFVALEHWLGGLTEFWHVWLGAILLLIVLFAKGGLVGLLSGRPASHD